MFFDEPEPWNEPVNAAELASDVAGLVRRYVVVSEEAITAITLWIMHTYVHDAAIISPILAISSPEKRCGKTRLMALISRLVHRSLMMSNVTTAVMFRVIERYSPTLLIDEADTFIGEDSTLIGVINSGQNRAGAYVARITGDQNEPQLFSTWSPKAISLIKNLPPTIEDRSVVITMKRKLTGEAVEQLRALHTEIFHIVRRKLVRWSKDSLDRLSSADPLIPDGLNDRQADNWTPLLAIADDVSQEFADKARKAACVLSNSRQDYETRESRLLRDIRSIFNGTVQRVPSELLCKELNAIADAPWSSYSDGRGLNQNALARMLSPYGVKPVSIHIPGQKGSVRGYRIEDFDEVFARYLAGDAAWEPKEAR